MPGEVFGEADVILRVRLEELQGQLDQAEMLIVQQQQRVQQAQTQTAATARVSAQTADDSAGAFERLGGAATDAATAFTALRVTLVALRVALFTLATGGALAVITAFGAIVDAGNRTLRAMRDIADATRELDGSTESVRRLAEEIEKIPVVGGLAANTFRIFSGNTEVADKALLSLVGTVEDGQVKLGGLRRAFLSAFASDMVQDIDEINERLRIMNAELGKAGEFNVFGGEQAGRLDQIENQAANANQLEGLEGIERVRAENQLRHEERMSQFDNEQRALNDFLALQMEQIRLSREEGEISQEEATAARRRLNAVAGIQQDLINERRVQTSEELNELAQKRVEAFREEEARLQAIERQERQRMEAAAESAELRAAGRGFDADLVDLAAREQEAIAQATRNGHEDRLDLIRRFYDARRDMIEQAREEERRREEQAQEERQQRERMQLFDAFSRRMQEEQRMEDRRRGLESQIRAGELRLGGEDFEARREEIKSEFQQRALEAIRNGDEELVELLDELRDIRLKQLDRLEQEQQIRDAERDADARVGSVGSARQIDSALSLINGTDDPKQEEKQMVEEQKKTNKLLGRQRVARAG